MLFSQQGYGHAQNFCKADATKVQLPGKALSEQFRRTFELELFFYLAGTCLTTCMTHLRTVMPCLMARIFELFWFLSSLEVSCLLGLLFAFRITYYWREVRGVDVILWEIGPQPVACLACTCRELLQQLRDPRTRDAGEPFSQLQSNGTRMMRMYWSFFLARDMQFTKVIHSLLSLLFDSLSSLLI